MAARLLTDGSGADLRPSGEGKAAAHLSLAHEWTSPSRLELSGRLTLAGASAAGRRVAIGRLGERLPTRRLQTVVTDDDGRFSVMIAVERRRMWRVATAFYAGSASTWSTTAFDGLRP